MQVLIISSKDAQHRYLHISNRSLILLVLLILVIAISLFFENDRAQKPSQGRVQIQSLPQPIERETKIQERKNQSIARKNLIQYNINPVYVKKLGELQAEAIRLKALAERIAKETGIDISSFDISQPPAEGGINGGGTDLSEKDMSAQMDELTKQLDTQARHISQLESILTTARSTLSAIPSGYPIKRSEGGWLSSRYGYRIDPFTGKKAFHRGLDFAGKVGSDVVAVADGIVLWAGKKQGYGYVIDIDHGNGYVTRYAHNKELIVNSGQRVKKGQIIAKMGTTGRSTGPHVHFEVIKDGHVINPYQFIKS